MAHFVDGRCYREVSTQVGPPLFSEGNLNFQAHHVGWIVSGFFTVIACVVSFWLINKHLQWYTIKREQRYIVRLLFMVPIYAIISLVSYLFWNQSTPLILIRDAYESIVLTSFFYLLLMYISPDPAEQRRVFLEKGLSKEADKIAIRKGKKVKKWVLPLGFVKWKPQDGMYFLQIQKWGVLQYAVVRPLTTLAAVVLDYMGLYCEGSWGLGWGHVYILIIVSLSVTVAMYCLIQLYFVVADELAPYKPLLKLFSVKAVVFLTFWQASFLSLLAMFNVVKDTKYMTAEDINIGIGAIVETFEMMLFAFLHIKAFSYIPYKPGPESVVNQGTVPKRTPRWRSLGHAMDFRETFREIWVGIKYMWSRSRKKTPKVDAQAMKTSHYSRAFEEVRPSHMSRSSRPTSEKDSKSKVDRHGEKKLPTLPIVDIHVDRSVEADIGGERQWLGIGDDYGYGLGYLQREKSESLEAQIQRELALRGYSDEIPGRGHIGKPDEDLVGHTRGKRSWWRSLYDRLSTTGQEEEDQQRLTASSSKRRGRNASHTSVKGISHNNSRDLEIAPVGQRLLSEYDHNYHDPPPTGLLRPYSQRFKSGRVISDSRSIPAPRNDGELDMLAPLSVFNDRRKTSRPLPPAGNTQPTPLPPQPSSSGPYLFPPGRIQRSDSLLGRMFPDNTDAESSTEQGHASDSAQSLPSVTTHGVRPSRATPKASLIPGVPRIIPQGQNIGMAGERSILTSTVQQDKPEQPQYLTIEITPASESNPPMPERFVTPPSTPAPQSPPLSPDAPTGSPPSPSSIPTSSTVTVLSPLVTGDGVVSSPLSDLPPLPFGSNEPVMPTPRPLRQNSGDINGLKRSSARIYARDSLPHQSRRQSMPVVPAPYDPRIPVPDYIRHRHPQPEPVPAQRQGRSSRSNSAPMPPGPSGDDNARLIRPPAVHEQRSSHNNMGGDITQPSHSGTPTSPKFPPSVKVGAPQYSPPPLAMLPEASSRYPSLIPHTPNPRPVNNSRPPAPLRYSNTHMKPAGPSSPPPIRHTSNSRPYTTTDDLSSSVSYYRPPL
ncbi:organic solute transporter Ostalpha-domain-containing protein [Flagelloscypha sp. PMI_526]|nr:organic solute transporter Ostalpha-domain-containing protein [Flagelloscypha sp. PMI_526]